MKKDDDKKNLESTVTRPCGSWPEEGSNHEKSNFNCHPAISVAGAAILDYRHGGICCYSGGNGHENDNFGYYRYVGAYDSPDVVNRDCDSDDLFPSASGKGDR